MSDPDTPAFYALVDYQDPYVEPLMIKALESKIPKDQWKLIPDLSDYPSKGGPLLQWRQYESIVFEFALENRNCLVNAYVIRKALIRKHYLSTTISHWITKNPTSLLKHHFKPAVDFELDYAEFLDDALVEAYELRDSFTHNEDKFPEERQWWILKPGMSDRGQGIRLFSTEEELTSIFEEWEADAPDEDEDEDAEEAAGPSSEPSKSQMEDQGDYIITSQLRHFIAQPYIHPPLLIPGNDRKFHIRTYVLAVGSLKVYVYRSMLALFAAEPYPAPWEDPAPDLRAHLTNTCLQTGEREGSVQEFWSLPDDVALAAGSGSSKGWKDEVFSQICQITGEVFEAAARGMMVHFQPLERGFEIFGLDFLVDSEGQAWLLEVNAFPDFRQTGDELKGVVEGLFEEVVETAVKPFFGLGSNTEGSERLVRVLDVDLGRR